MLKQIQRKLHVFFSQLEVDEAAGRRASMLKDHMASIDLDLAKGKEATVSLMQVANQCKLFQQLVECLAAVPASPESQHAELRAKGLEARARLEDCLLYICFSSIVWNINSMFPGAKVLASSNQRQVMLLEIALTA